MKKIVVFVFMLLCISKSNYAQTFNELISKEWALEYYGENEEKQPPSPAQKEDRMIFYKDNKALSIEGGKTQEGSWKYDSTKKQLTIVEIATQEVWVMNIIKLTEEEFVLGFKDPEAEGKYLKMYMVPVKKVN